MAHGEYTIPIPGELRSVALNGRGLSADGVYDYIKNASQEDINKGVLEAKSFIPVDFSGMGRVILPKNIQDVSGTDKNLLTQDMFYKGEVGSRVPNTNTIFVIQYDYELAENITIPSGCVLDFQGGNISGAYTITGQNTGIEAGLVKIFNTNVTLAGTWNITCLYADWFGAKADGETDSVDAINKALLVANAIKVSDVLLSAGTYKVTSTIYLRPNTTLKGSMEVRMTWVGNATTNIYADFADNKSFIISTFTQKISDQSMLAYNQMLSGSAMGEWTPCPLCGVENLRIDARSNVFGGIRMALAYGYKRKNISITNCVYNGIVTMASWGGVDDIVSLRGYTYTGMLFLADTNENIVRQCTVGGAEDSVVDADYVFPIMTSNISTITSYCCGLFTYYSRSLYLEGFCIESGNVGMGLLQSSVRVVSPYIENLKDYIYAIISSALYVGRGTLDNQASCKAIKSSGSSKIISEENLMDFGVELNVNSDSYYPIGKRQLVASSVDDMKKLSANYAKYIDNVYVNGTLAWTGNNNGCVINHDVEIEGSATAGASVIDIGQNSYTPRNNLIGNLKIKVSNITFNETSDQTANFTYNTVFNCKQGVINIEFTNCIFNLGGNCSVINNIISLGSNGRPDARGGSVINAVFNNCTFNGKGTVIDENCIVNSLGLQGCTFNNTTSVGGTVSNTYQSYGGTV